MSIVRNVIFGIVIFVVGLIFAFTCGMIEHPGGDALNRLITSILQSTMLTIVIMCVRLLALRLGDTYEEDSDC